MASLPLIWCATSEFLYLLPSAEAKTGRDSIFALALPVSRDSTATLIGIKNSLAIYRLLIVFDEISFQFIPSKKRLNVYSSMQFSARREKFGEIYRDCMMMCIFNAFIHPEKCKIEIVS